MRYVMKKRQHRTLCCFVWCMWVVGCAGKSASVDRYVPRADTARTALETALNGWQNGQPPGEIKGSPIAVQVVDTHRRPEQRLERFQILGEVGGDAGRCFSVRLTMANPIEEQKVRFVVIGISPLWVFREEDLTMLSHWEHPMPSEAKAEANDETNKDKS